jgi:hypothetical protein
VENKAPKQTRARSDAAQTIVRKCHIGMLQLPHRHVHPCHIGMCPCPLYTYSLLLLFLLSLINRWVIGEESGLSGIPEPVCSVPTLRLLIARDTGGPHGGWLRLSLSERELSLPGGRSKGFQGWTREPRGRFVWSRSPKPLSFATAHGGDQPWYNQRLSDPQSL